MRIMTTSAATAGVMAGLTAVLLRGVHRVLVGIDEIEIDYPDQVEPDPDRPSRPDRRR